MLTRELYTELGRRCGLNPSDSVHKARMVSAAKDALKEMYRRCKFVALIEDFSFSTVDGTYYYYLDPRVLKPFNFRAIETVGDDTSETSKLKLYGRERFNREFPNPSTSSDDEDIPNIIVPIKKVGIDAQPTAASKLSLVSSSSSDVTSYYAVVRGEVSGIESVS